MLEFRQIKGITTTTTDSLCWLSVDGKAKMFNHSRYEELQICDWILEN